ncbi:MAG: DUF2085 domain-containing protein [Ktedonobacteraceae bacterium]|nr:DUF2085 domain-containing protein [Ktedonobacteraceae bacterium]
MASAQIPQNPTQTVQRQPKQRAFVIRLKAFYHATGEFLLEHWASIITIALGLLVFNAILIPFLSYLGLDAIARPLFSSMHYVCAQIPSHSYYILGHQFGLCERNFAIYSSMFAGSLIFTLSKKRLPGLPWWIWILLMLPMAWDGFTQMFGWRESDWILRTVTGVLFGFGNVWFALPMMQKALLQTPSQTPPLPRRPLPVPPSPYRQVPATDSPAPVTATQKGPETL